MESLEAVAGWKTARLNRPVLILGNLDGVETGVRNLRRQAPLETETHETELGSIIVPTLAEMCRIKAYLVVSRNATRDHIDFAALADRIEQKCGPGEVWKALSSLDDLYPQENDVSMLLQLAKQLVEPMPYDIGNGDLSQYRIVAERWKSWKMVCEVCEHCGVEILQRYGSG